MTTRFMNAILPVVAILLGAAGLQGCSGSQDATAAEGASTETPATPVKTVKLVPKGAPMQVRFTAVVTPDEVIKVAPQVPGKVKSVLVEKGQTVKAGQVLMALDDQDLTLKTEQAKKAHETALKRLDQLKLASEIEEKSLELGIKQAEEALMQVKARARVVQTGARPQEKKQVQAALDMAKVRLESTKRELDRMNSLLQSEVIPKQNFEQVEDGHKLAEAQYRQALEQLQLLNLGARSEDRDAMDSAVRQTEIAVEMSRVAARRVETTRMEIQATELAVQQAELGVKMAELALSWTQVTAPCAGVVDQVLVEEGAIVGAGVPAFVVMETGKTEIQVQLREEDRRLVSDKSVAHVTFDGLEGEGPFTATVKRLSETADSATGKFPLYLAPEEKVAARLKAGMFVRGVLDVGHKENVLTVPNESVLRNEGKRLVYIIDGGKSMKRIVETGQQYEKEVEVLTGLAAGEEVVVEGQVGLVDGMAVVVQAEPAAK